MGVKYINYGECKICIPASTGKVFIENSNILSFALFFGAYL